MPITTMRELLEGGVHYGHHTSRWNPQMAPYIFQKRHSIHIVDLRETVRGLVRACRFLSTICEQGAEVILVGTKKQARATVHEQATRGGIHYVAERWLGGMLTNFRVVTGRLNRLKELEELEATGEIESRGKKLASVLRRQLTKLRKNLGGVRDMTRLPDAMIVIDPRREKNALREANALDIPTIVFLDTDASPDMADIVIPGNDDAMRSIQLICTKLMDAVLEGRAKAPLTAEAMEQAAAPPPAPAPAPAPATTPAEPVAAPEPAPTPAPTPAAPPASAGEAGTEDAAPAAGPPTDKQPPQPEASA